NGIPQTGNMVGSITDHNASFFSMDYNGDGRTDIARIVDGGQFTFEIYEIAVTYNPVIALGTPTNSLEALYYNNVYPNKNTVVYTGDFNGDGNTDMITWGDAPWGWHIHYSNGNNGFSRFTLSESIVDHISPNGPTHSSQGPYPDYLYIAEDFNGDGYCD